MRRVIVEIELNDVDRDWHDDDVAEFVRRRLTDLRVVNVSIEED